MFSFAECAIPLVAAPMAGGPSTPQLVAAASEAGGFGFLGGGYLTSEALETQLNATRERIATPFGVNLFVPDAHPRTGLAPQLLEYRRELLSEARRYDVELPEPDPTDTDHYDDKLTLLVRQPVAVVSFTFGLPGADAVARPHAVGSHVAITVTDPAEARDAIERGADSLVLQGANAGGHRGTHNVASVPDSTPLVDLVRAVRAQTSVPIVAAGGVCSREQVAELLAAGASAIAVGTALLRTLECGTARAHKDALVSGAFTETRVTRAFSGRLARALVNRFVVEHDAAAPPFYPEVNQLSRPLRAAAAKVGDVEGLSLWAGAGFASSRADDVATVLSSLSPR